jgi:hypothetical protein
LPETSEILLSKDTSIPLTVDWIRKISVEGTKNPVIINIARECKKEKEPLQCVFDKVYDLIVYEPCPENTQTVRTIENMLRTGQGNCVNYSTMIASILLLMNVPFFFRTVSYQNPREYDHIYIVTKSGIVLDPVQGQKQDGTDTRQNRPPYGFFNKEVKYKYKKDYAMTELTLLQGTIGSAPKDKAGYPKTISRSRYLRQKRAGVMGCANCNTCAGCSGNRPMGRTWFGTAWSFIKDVAVESVISPINVTALQVSGKNLIKYDPNTGIGDKYVQAQNFAGYMVNDSIKVGIQAPITSYNTVTGATVDPNFTYHTELAPKFAQTEKKAQYLLVNTIGSLFGIHAYDTSKTTKSLTTPKITIADFSTSPAKPATIESAQTTDAGFGTYALIGMGLLALGSMKTEKPKKKKTR